MVKKSSFKECYPLVKSVKPYIQHHAMQMEVLTYQLYQVLVGRYLYLFLIGN